MESESTRYASPSEWLRHNRKSLGPYAGEWIAFTRAGVIFHHPSGHFVTQQARQTQQEYALKYVHPLEVSRIVRIVPIRIRSLKNNKWQPDYTLSIRTSTITETLTMLVDSGADITVIPKWTGDDLGLQLAEDEYIEKASTPLKLAL